MYHTFPEKDQPSVPLLYYMFAKLEMDNNKPNEALKILVSMSGTQPYGKLCYKQKDTGILIYIYVQMKRHKCQRRLLF
jgi:hypothetical protein